MPTTTLRAAPCAAYDRNNHAVSGRKSCRRRPRSVTGTTGTGAARALLPPRLFAAAANQTLSFGRRRAGAPIGQLHDHRLMQQMGPRFSAENLIVEVWLDNVDFHFNYLLTAGRKITTPCLAPGTAPRTNIRFSSARISTTMRFCVAICSLPQWPAIFLPLRTRPGKNGYRWSRHGGSIHGCHGNLGNRQTTNA